MEANRVIEIIDEGKKANWSEYATGKSRKLMPVTFHLLCHKLIESDSLSCPSVGLTDYIAERMQSNRTPITNSQSNPGSHFTQQYSDFINKKKTDFRPEWAEIVYRQGQPGNYTYILNPQFSEIVSRYFGREPPLMNDQQGSRENSDATGDSDLKRLGGRLFWDPPGMMETVVKLLRETRQIIFYGPPGTGKTFVARKLAKHLMGSDEPTFLQFHPSYAYEDFFEGYRPVPDGNGGMPQFRLVPGPLKILAETACKNPLREIVLVIDEINRGNLAKIFGELYFLLEYRHEHIRLQYGGDTFGLPKNLLIIGTMNTADRSISHLDAALRRRFHFFPLFPDKEPIQGLLRRYLKSTHPALERVADLVDQANKQLGSDRHDLIGHSYFIRKDLDKWVELIWNHSIMPLIEDRFIDEPDKIKLFQDMLRSWQQEAPALEPA